MKWTHNPETDRWLLQFGGCEAEVYLDDPLVGDELEWYGLIKTPKRQEYKDQLAGPWRSVQACRKCCEDRIQEELVAAVVADIEAGKLSREKLFKQIWEYFARADGCADSGTNWYRDKPLAVAVKDYLFELFVESFERLYEDLKE